MLAHFSRLRRRLTGHQVSPAKSRSLRRTSSLLTADWGFACDQYEARHGTSAHAVLLGYDERASVTMPLRTLIKSSVNNMGMRRTRRIRFRGFVEPTASPE